MIISDNFFKNFDQLKKFTKSFNIDHPDNNLFLINDRFSIQEVFALLKEGIADFIETPFNKRRFSELFSRFSDNVDSYESGEIFRLVESELNIVGSSKRFLQFVTDIAEIYAENYPIIIAGEIGSEKFKIAHFFHQHSRFANGKLIRRNFKKFTGDVKAEFQEIAKELNQGTLILEELNFLAKGAEKALKDILSVYHKQKLDKNLNLIFTFSTNKENPKYNLKNNEVNILDIPTLRDIKSDISDLVLHRLKILAENYATEEISIDGNVLEIFAKYNWPGNLFELNNLVDSLFLSVVNENSDKISKKYLPDNFSQKPKTSSGIESNFEIMSSDLKAARAIFEKDYISEQLKRFSGNVSQTASFIGMERTALHRKLISLNIDSENLRKTIKSVEN